MTRRPRPVGGDGSGDGSLAGQHLRDYFAGQALGPAIDFAMRQRAPNLAEASAKLAYQMADAMLTAREAMP